MVANRADSETDQLGLRTVDAKGRKSLVWDNLVNDGGNIPLGSELFKKARLKNIPEGVIH